MTEGQKRGHEAEDCCVDARIPKHFDATSRKRTAGGALPPMHAVSRRLYEQLADADKLAPSLLEVGSGNGALTVALVSLGASDAQGIDLSHESVLTARRRAEAAGVSDRAQFEIGDGARAQLSERDWVVLDRVMCCYPDVDGLLANTIPAARLRYAFSVPNSRGRWGVLTKILIPLEYLVTTLQRVPCRAYVHSLDKVEDKLQAAGFRLRSRTIGFWYTAVWERRAAT